MHDYKTLLRRAGAVLFWLAVWQAAAMAIGQEVFLVSPVQALRCLLRLLPQADFWHRVGFSAGRILLGFGLGVVCSAALAVAAEICPAAEVLIAPVLQLVKATPVASFIIICLIWMSSSRLSIFISFLMVLPIVYTNVLQSIRSADRQLLEAVSIFRLSWPKRALYLWLPQLKPYLLSACTVSLGISWKAGIAAEIIGIPAGSIGRMFYDAKVYFNTVDLFAWTVIVVVISVLFEKGFLALLKGIFGRLETL